MPRTPDDIYRDALDVARVQTYTTAEITAELERELTMRHRVYKSIVAKGTTPVATLARRVALLEQAIARLAPETAQQELL